MEGEIVASETIQKGELPINCPAPLPHSHTNPSKPQSGNPLWIVITLHKESRLLQYESHNRSPVACEPELTPVVREAIHQVVPFAIQDQAEVLVLQLGIIEHQCHGFYEIEVPDAIAIALHNYHQRRKREILAELDELKDSKPAQ